MKAYANGKVFTGDQILPNLCVLTDNGKIIELVESGSVPAHAQIIDLNGHILAPAFIDIQIYGGNGHFFGEFPSVNALKATYDYCKAGGATLFLPTVATNSEAVMFAAIDAVQEYWRSGGQGVAGLHLEGPYINPAKRGAHIAEFIQQPTLEGIKNLLDYGAGVIKMMTIAPEVCPDEVLDYLLQQDIVVSAGHTNANYRQAMAAFERGIKTATHLFNAMSPLQHREPGMVGAIFDHPSVQVSMVADGYHVDFPAVRIAKKLLGERLFLITDAVAENPNGHYSHRLQGDMYVVADGTLSGSALTMVKAVKNCINQVGISMEEALRMASLYPARVLGKDRQYGKIETGFAENFVVLNKQADLISVICPDQP